MPCRVESSRRAFPFACSAVLPEILGGEASLQRRLSSFELDTLVVAEVYVLVNHLVSFREGVWFLPVNALCFEDGKEIFSHRIVIWIPAS